jgi:hypothetical protein
LSQERVRRATELRHAAEPELALLGIAWDLSPYRDALPEHVVRLIKEEGGDLEELHPGIRQ